MRLNRKEMAVLVIYALALAYLFSYLTMVKTFSCGCEYRYTGWFWEKGPLLYDLGSGKDGEPVQLAWSIDWWRLIEKVTVATITALLAFIWIGDSNSGWRDGIAKVMDRFTVILLSLGFLAIAVALTGVVLNHGEAPKVGQGPIQDYVLFSHNPIYWIRRGLYYASFLFYLSFGTLLTSLIVDFERVKLQYLLLCISGFVLVLCVRVYLMMLRN